MTDNIIRLDHGVKANAVVEQLRGGPVPLWEVEVNGLPPHDQRRVYTIEAKEDSMAAFEGIRLFVEEMTALQDFRGN